MELFIILYISMGITSATFHCSDNVWHIIYPLLKHNWKSLARGWQPGRWGTGNGIRVCAALKTPYSRLPDHSLRPPFQNFSVLPRPYIHLKSQFFLKICISEQQNLMTNILEEMKSTYSYLMCAVIQVSCGIIMLSPRTH